MQAEGLRARAIDFKNVTLVSGTSDYVLTTDVIDVIGDAMFIDPDQVDVNHATGEVPIVAIGRDDWQLLSDKSMEGRPTMFYWHRSLSMPSPGGRLEQLGKHPGSGALLQPVHYLGTGPPACGPQLVEHGTSPILRLAGREQAREV